MSNSNGDRSTAFPVSPKSIAGQISINQGSSNPTERKFGQNSYYSNHNVTDRLSMEKT